MKAKPTIKANSDNLRINNWSKYILIATVLFLLFNTLNHDYNLDDNLVTNHHPLTSKGIEAVGEIFTSSYFVDNMGHEYGYRPIVLFSFAIEHQIFGEKPSVSHVINGAFYLLTVLAFYKFLKRLLGPEKMNLALISTLIFAVHPIHSEVVASIKNRDEILALYFALCAALSMLSFVEKKKWSYFIFMVLFFSIGLLAKKSVFPLAFILPISLLLFQNISFRNYGIVSLGLLIPAALIGSELDPNRLLLISVLGTAVLAVSFLLHYFTIAKINAKEMVFLIKEKSILLISIVIIALLSAFSVYLKSPFILLGILPFLFFQTENKREIIPLTSALFLLMVSTLFGVPWVSKVLIVVLVWLIIDNFKNTNQKMNFLWFFILIGALFFILYPEFKIGNLILIFLTILLFVLASFRLLLAWILYGVILLVTARNFDFALPLSMGILLIFQSIKTQKKVGYKDKLISFLIGVSTVVCVSQSSISLEQDRIRVNSSNSLEWRVNANQKLKEGRPLTYIENTLVSDTDFQSRSATGLYSLGEYLRLMIAPVNLSFYYGFARIQTVDFKNGWVWLSLIGYITLFWFAWKQRIKQPSLTLGVLWFSFSIFLFSNWFELVAGMVGERLAFTASAGFSLFLGSIFIWVLPTFNLLKPKKKDWFVIGTLLLGVSLFVQRNSLWKDRFSLMSHDIKHLESSVQAHNLYGLALMDAAQQPYYTQQKALEMKQKALREFRKSLQLYPKFFNAQFDIGRVLAELGDFNSAYSEFNKAHEMDTTNALALEEMVKSAFEARMHKEVLINGQKYLQQNPQNELIYELVAYSCLLNQDFQNCEQIAKKGAALFAENPNFQRMVLDSKNKIVVK